MKQDFKLWERTLWIRTHGWKKRGEYYAETHHSNGTPEKFNLVKGKTPWGVSFGRSSPLDSWLHHCQVCDETEHHDGRELAQQNEAAYLAMAARSRAGGGRDKEREREEGIS